MVTDGRKLAVELTSDNIQESDEFIGKGTWVYGKVFKVSYFGAVCTAKELCGALEANRFKTEDDGNLKDRFLSECQWLIQLRHPNIVQFLGIYFRPANSSKVPVMVVEKMENDLSGFLQSHARISDAVKLSILLDVSLGLWYLHGQKPPVVHCNLTSNSVLLTSQLQAKISDVGVIQMMESEKQSLVKKNVQCASFMAPEVRTDVLSLSFRELVCRPSVDIFSYGAVVLHTVTQQWPEPLVDDASEVNRVQTEVDRYQSQIDQITISNSKLLKAIVISCLDNDPSRRPTITRISGLVRKMTEKLPIIRKSLVAWQAEVEQSIKQVHTYT